MAAPLAPIISDNGSGFSKIGYVLYYAPIYVIESFIPQLCWQFRSIVVSFAVRTIETRGVALMFLELAYSQLP